MHYFVGKQSRSAAIRQLVLQESGGTVDGLLQLKKETHAIVSQGKCTPEDRQKLKAITKLYRKAVKAEVEGKASASGVKQEDSASTCNCPIAQYCPCIPGIWGHFHEHHVSFDLDCLMFWDVGILWCILHVPVSTVQLVNCGIVLVFFPSKQWSANH